MKNLSFPLLNAEETLTISTKIYDILIEDLNSDSFCGKVLPLVTTTNSDLSEAIARSTSKSFTDMLSKADDEQDSAFIGLRDYVKAFTNNPDKKKQEAAQKLLKVIKTIGWSLWSEGYVKETALLKALIEELEKEENLEAMQTINAIDWFEHLKEKYAAFIEIGQQKIDAEAQKDIPLTSQSKKKIVKYISPLLAYINLMDEIEKGNYAAVSDKLDEAIVEVMSIARARQTRKENASQEE